MVSDFGKEVARLLAERGMSLRQAARLTHYDVSYMSKVINGRKPGSSQLAAALDKALDAGGHLTSLADTPDRRPLADVELIELACKVDASDLASGTMEL